MLYFTACFLTAFVSLFPDQPDHDQHKKFYIFVLNKVRVRCARKGLHTTVDPLRSLYGDQIRCSWNSRPEASALLLRCSRCHVRLCLLVLRKCLPTQCIQCLSNRRQCNLEHEVRKDNSVDDLSSNSWECTSFRVPDTLPTCNGGQRGYCGKSRV